MKVLIFAQQAAAAAAKALAAKGSALLMKGAEAAFVKALAPVGAGPIIGYQEVYRPAVKELSMWMIRHPWSMDVYAEAGYALSALAPGAPTASPTEEAEMVRQIWEILIESWQAWREEERQAGTR